MIDVNKIYLGDCIDVMKAWPENFVDTIITDPPYGIRFMGKAWDGADIEKTIESKRRHTPRTDSHGGYSIENRAWAEGEYDRSPSANLAFQIWCTEWAAAALRIVKPGGTMLVFGGTRTFHRMTSGLEDAGWQIRDCLMWLYGSGFPKSHNLHGDFEGWGTALKPAWEPIIVAMKPCDGTFAENAEKWGVAGLNVDGGRIGTSDVLSFGSRELGDGIKYGKCKPSTHGIQNPQGRWPANLLLDEEAAGMIGDESRFFYIAKSAKAERNEGCWELPQKETHRYGAGIGEGKNPEAPVVEKNNHPTVKPLSLMKYLCNLTRTPTGGIVLDPFAGSGTTLWASEYHNRPWIGIEMNAEYVKIAEARIARERSQMKMAI